MNTLDTLSDILFTITVNRVKIKQFTILKTKDDMKSISEVILR